MKKQISQRAQTSVYYCLHNKLAHAIQGKNFDHNSNSKRHSCVLEMDLTAGNQIPDIKDASFCPNLR